MSTQSYQDADRSGDIRGGPFVSGGPGSAGWCASEVVKGVLVECDKHTAMLTKIGFDRDERGWRKNGGQYMCPLDILVFVEQRLGSA